MIRVFATIFTALFFSGCAATSKPANLSDSLNNGYGVIIFSTIDDGTSTDFHGEGMRAINAVLSLGLSEVGSENDFQLHFTKRDEKTNKIDSTFYVFHPYISRERALTKKWHILKLKEGNYELDELSLFKGNTQKIIKLENSYAFKVSQGESLYLGDFKLALKYAKTILPMPVITSIEWDMNEASTAISAYKNYPKRLNRAEQSKNL